jgi:hypothetical protein
MPRGLALLTIFLWESMPGAGTGAGRPTLTPGGVPRGQARTPRQERLPGPPRARHMASHPLALVSPGSRTQGSRTQGRPLTGSASPARRLLILRFPGPNLSARRALAPTAPPLMLRVPAVPVPTLPVPTLPVLTLPVPAVPVPTLPVLTLPVPAVRVLTLPVPAVRVPAVPVPTLPVPTLPVLTLPVPAVRVLTPRVLTPRGPTLRGPTLRVLTPRAPTLRAPTLPARTRPDPACPGPLTTGHPPQDPLCLARPPGIRLFTGRVPPGHRFPARERRDRPPGRCLPVSTRGRQPRPHRITRDRNRLTGTPSAGRPGRPLAAMPFPVRAVRKSPGAGQDDHRTRGIPAWGRRIHLGPGWCRPDPPPATG